MTSEILFVAGQFVIYFDNAELPKYNFGSLQGTQMQMATLHLISCESFLNLMNGGE